MAGQTDALTAIATLLGGTKTTSSAGDTAALRAVLAQLQGEDYSALLQSIFQQAAGSIPGLTTAYSNALGARRGSNSGVQASLNDLLSQVALKGQQQIAAQRTANQQTQAQVAAAIANATKGTTGTTGVNLGSAAKNLFTSQIAAEGYKRGKSLFDGLTSGASGSSGASTISGGVVSPTADMSIGGSILQTSPLDAGINYGPASFDIGSALTDSPIDFSGISDWGSGSTDIPIEDTGLFADLTSYGVFADGGLVGRDGHTASLKPETEEDAQEDTAELKAAVRFDPGFTRNAQVDLIQKLLHIASGPAKFADGGRVISAPGARSSSAQTIVPNKIVRTAANNTMPQASNSGISTADVGLATGSGNGNPSFGEADPATARYARSVLNALNVANTAQLTSIPGIGALTSLVNADNREGVLGALGLAVLSAINPMIGMVASPMVKSAADNAAMDRGAAALADANPGIGYDESTAPTDADVTAADSGYSGSGGSYDRGGAFGFGNSAGGNMGSDQGGGVHAAANGGPVRGPGTGTSDSIPAVLSNGEYVLSADTVAAVGTDFLDKLQAAFHTPVNKGK